MTPAALLFALAIDSTAVDSIALTPVVVEAQAVSVSMRGDTIVYCVASFVERQGERLKALLQSLPGVEVTADGSIRAKGRNVNRLLINGKRLTGLKENVILENLRADALVSIRLYDDVCERDRETGVAQASEEQVMDLVTHEDKRKAWLCDLTGGAGTQHRYAANGSASRFSDTWQNMFTAAFNNLPGTFGVGESYYDKLQKQVPSADSHRRNLSIMTGWEDNRWRINTSAYYDGAKSKDGSHNIFETLLPGMTSVQENHDRSHSTTGTLSVQVGIEWHDSLTSLHIDPYFTWTHGKSHYMHSSRTTAGHGHMVNKQMAENDSHNADYAAEVNMRLNRQIRSKPGRNVDISLGLSSGRQDESASDGNIISYYWGVKGDSFNIPVVEHSLRLIDAETNRSGMMLRASYVEPLTQHLKVLAEYSLAYREDKADHPVYLIDLQEHGMANLEAMQHNDSLSRNASNRELCQRGRAVLQLTKGTVRLGVGGVVEAGRAQTTYERHSLRLDTAHNTTDWSPEMHFTWRGKKGWSITATYDGRTRRPSILDLIPVDDTSDPLNIRCGNPGLRNAFTHTMCVSLYYFSAGSERQLNLQIGGNIEQRALTQSVNYNRLTGVRRYSTINTNGNRHLDAAWGFQSAFGKAGRWYLDLQGTMNGSRRVGQQNVDDNEAYCYVTRQTQLVQYAAIQFKHSGISVKPYAYGRYERMRSNLAGAIKRDLYTFGYGGVTRYESGFGLSVGVDAYNHCRRGYAEKRMNADEIIIDAELSYAFLRGRNAEISVQINDLLGQRDMVQTYTYTSGRSEYSYDCAVTTYATATFTYRF